MNELNAGTLLERLIEDVELPDNAYEKARDRYEDLGKWFGRDDSLVKANNPHIFPQGSFRLGTAIKPLDENSNYDLDLGCKLRTGISSDTHTQKQLKDIVRTELENYRTARRIMEKVEDKHRCLCLEYRDSPGFHMDIVPCIPAADIQRASLRIAILKHNPVMEIAVDPITGNAVYITDDRLPNFNRTYGNWLVSNMEGYALWFEMRMNLDKTLMSKTAAKFETRIDDVPQFIRKRPLQKAIQLLKRHRDVLFRKKDELKPISVILTTLAAQAYQGEAFVADAIAGILSRIENGIRKQGKKVPNPVNPEEDFADKWTMPQYAHLKLEENFRNWVIQAKTDFQNLTDLHNAETINKVAKLRFDVTLNRTEISKLLCIPLIEVIANPIHIANPVKPWCM